MTAAGTSILFCLLGDQTKASSRVRGWWVADELRQIGYGVTTHVSSGGAAGLAATISQITRHQVVIFQKTYGRYDPWLARLARALGKVTLFDIDDAPSRDGMAGPMKNALAMMHECDAVLVGSSALAELAAPHARHVVRLPSAVQIKNYAAKKEDRNDGVACLGWLGNGAHYAADLVAHLPGALAAVGKRYPVKFRIVGACAEPTLYEAFGAIEGVDTEFIDTLDWGSPEAVGAAVAPFDIGLYPLDPGPFNDYKCGFKAIEYMALGLPVIASDVAAASDIVVDGATGLLVNGRDGWVDAIVRLLEDRPLARQMGEAGRARVEQEFTVARVAERLARAIDTLRANGKVLDAAA